MALQGPSMGPDSSQPTCLEVSGLAGLRPALIASVRVYPGGSPSQKVTHPTPKPADLDTDPFHSTTEFTTGHRELAGKLHSSC